MPRAHTHTQTRIDYDFFFAIQIYLILINLHLFRHVHRVGSDPGGSILRTSTIPPHVNHRIAPPHTHDWCLAQGQGYEGHSHNVAEG